MNKKAQKMTYPKEDNAKLKDANRELRAKVKRQKNEIVQLQRRLDQYEDAFARNYDHITGMMEGMTVEDAIRITKKQSNKSKPETKEIVKEKFKEMYSRNKNEEK